MSFKIIEIGLPFFDDINKQVSKKSYFNSYIMDWKSAGNRFLPFQFNAGVTSGIVSFDLVNSETGTTVDYLSHFTTNMISTEIEGDYYYTYLGLVDVSVATGRYYFHVVGAGGREWWSEEFVMCGDIEEEYEYLLISTTDYLLLDSTDKLKIV